MSIHRRRQRRSRRNRTRARARVSRPQRRPDALTLHLLLAPEKVIRRRVRPVFHRAPLILVMPRHKLPERVRIHAQERLKRRHRDVEFRQKLSNLRSQRRRIRRSRAARLVVERVQEIVVPRRARDGVSVSRHRTFARVDAECRRGRAPSSSRVQILKTDLGFMSSAVGRARRGALGLPRR